MPIAQVNGQSIFYEDTGGDAPVVIFSHGLFMDHSMFAPQVAALKNRWRCIAWDERGHGGTAGGSLAPFSYYDSADDLAALLAHLGVKRAVLAGMSQGGFLSMRCALTHPEIVAGLILIDTQAGQEDPAKIDGYMQLARNWSDNGLDPGTADFVESVILGVGWSGAAAWKAKWAAWKGHNIVGCMETLRDRDDITGRLGEIKVPTLIVHGDADAAIDLHLAQVLHEKIAGSRLAVIPGGGHAANLTHADVVNPAIEAFLSSLA